MCGNAIVEGSATLCDSVRVGEKARVGGTALIQGRSVIQESTWVNRRHQCVNIAGLRYNMTVSPGTVQVGCQTRTRVKDFTSQDAQREGLPPQLEKEYRKLLLQVKKVIRAEKSYSCGLGG